MQDIKQKYWDVLNGKKSLPDTLKIFGATEDEVKAYMDDLKATDIHDTSAFFGTSLHFANLAYLKLVELDEISADEMFTFGKTQNYTGDIAFKGKETFRYMGNEEWLKVC